MQPPATTLTSSLATLKLDKQNNQKPKAADQVDETLKFCGLIIIIIIIIIPVST